MANKVALSSSSSALLRAALRRPSSSLSSTISRCYVGVASKTLGSTRTFTHLPSLRPTLFPSPLSRQPTTTTTTSLSISSPPLVGIETTTVLDLIPRSAISMHPSFMATQIRCGPRATMSGASRLIQKRRHGFLSRIRTRNGRKMLERRKGKGRKRIAA